MHFKQHFTVSNRFMGNTSLSRKDILPNRFAKRHLTEFFFRRKKKTSPNVIWPNRHIAESSNYRNFIIANDIFRNPCSTESHFAGHYVIETFVRWNLPILAVLFNSKSYVSITITTTEKFENLTAFFIFDRVHQLRISWRHCMCTDG